MVSAYVNTILFYRSLIERTRKEEDMATSRELELDRLKRLENVERTLRELVDAIKNLEEKLNEQQESKSDKKSSKVPSKG